MNIFAITFWSLMIDSIIYQNKGTPHTISPKILLIHLGCAVFACLVFKGLAAFTKELS